MKDPFPFGWRIAAVVVAVVAVASGALLLKFCSKPAEKTSSSQKTTSASGGISDEATVDLSPSQLNAIKIEVVGTYSFSLEKEAVGNIAYDQDSTNKEAPSKPAPGNPAKCVVINISESDSPFIHLDQAIEARVSAWPDRVFAGKISGLGGSVWDTTGKLAVDPNSHRSTARCEIADPNNELCPGMLASVIIKVQDPQESVALPLNAVVRNGDGTMAVWVTTDRHRFKQKIIRIGLQKNGHYQILEGLQQGELAVMDGAIFLSNILNAPPDD